MHVEDIRKNWKDAFNCKKCAKKERTDCPCYLEWVEQNYKDGKIRIRKGCLFQILPQLLIQNTKAADGVHAATNSLRNEIVRVMEKAIALKQEEIEALKQEEIKALKDEMGSSDNKGDKE